MTIVILDRATFGEVSLEPISKLSDACQIYATTPPISLAPRLKEAKILVTNKVIIDEIAMEQAQDLELICIAATGTNNVDLEAAAKMGIAVTNVAGYSTPSVVSHTFAMYFHLAHHNSYHDQYTRHYQWCHSPTFTHLKHPFGELAEKTWAIIGMGAIGRAVAEVAKAFGCEVIYYSSSGKNTDQPFRHCGLDTLLETADVVSIHCPLNQQTHGLINHAKILRMKPTAILINTSRGGIVHEGDMAVALDLGVIAGAAFDVMSSEPPPRDHPFWQMQHPDRLFVTPHIAGLSIQSRQRLIAEVAANIQAFQNGNRHNRLV